MNLQRLAQQGNHLFPIIGYHMRLISTFELSIFFVIKLKKYEMYEKSQKIKFKKVSFYELFLGTGPGINRLRGAREPPKDISDELRKRLLNKR